MDAALAAVCAGSGNAVKRIEKWYATLHRYKLEKVKNDPELFKAFDFSYELKKPAAQNMRRIYIPKSRACCTKPTPTNS